MSAKILITEDEGIVAADIEDRLTSLGYQVVATCSSGAEAIIPGSTRRGERVSKLRLLALGIFWAGTASSPAMAAGQAAVRVELEGISFRPPAGWLRREPASGRSTLEGSSDEATGLRLLGLWGNDLTPGSGGHLSLGATDQHTAVSAGGEPGGVL